MGLKGTLWILCAFAIKGVWTSQQFEETPRDVEVNPGNPVILTCKVRNRKGECIWLKDGSAVGRIAKVQNYDREPENGDCSLEIYKVDLSINDGNYQCQVTPATTQEETLTSPIAKVTVREKPNPPRIEFQANQVQKDFTTRDGVTQRLHCISRKGNPPAVLKWFIDDQEITEFSNQTNMTDPEKEKTWQSDSLLTYTFVKAHNNKTLRCVALHHAYQRGSEEVTAKLRVQYSPTIRLEGPPQDEDIEEGEMVTLRCISDGNPSGTVIWEKAGNQGYFDVKEEITFDRINRQDSGVYSCQAKNDIGSSETLRYTIDVKYPPTITKIIPQDWTMTLALYTSTQLVCEAEGNPPPKYLWLRKVHGQQVTSWQECGRNATLHIHNVTYSYQGRYMCEASNTIKSINKRVQSKEISLDVIGAPQVLAERSRDIQRVVVEKDDDASISVLFCADPKPRRTFWEWGSLKLESGSDYIRHIAKPISKHHELEDCYDARLIVQKVEGGDSRKYTLNIENEKGQLKYVIALEVREPFAVSVVVGIIVGCIILLVVVILIVLYLLKSEKMCFRRRLKPGLTPESDSDAESARSAEHLHNGRLDGHEGAIPPDAIYSTPTKTRNDGADRNQVDRNENGGKEGIVYADLDLPLSHSDRNGKPKPAPRRPPERTEYAEIQFQSTSDEQAHL